MPGSNCGTLPWQLGSDQVSNGPVHVFDVGSLPVNLAALAAAEKLGVVAQRQRLQLIPDQVAIDRLDFTVTFQAAAQRLHLAIQIKPLHHLRQLRVGVIGANPVSVGYGLVKQQPSIARQHDTFFPHRDVDDFTILEAVAPGRIETEHTQTARQFTEVDVDNKGGHPQRPGAKPLQRSNIQAFEDRVDRDSVTIF